MTVLDSLREITSALPNPPTAVADLGRWTGQAWPRFDSTTVKKVAFGPNSQLTYSIDLPGRILSEIEINRAALTVGSAWYLLQYATNPPSPYCLRSQVVPITPYVEAHEGLNYDANSHSRAFRDKYNTTLATAIEAVVGGDSTYYARALAVLNVASDSAFAAAALIDVNHPVSYPCIFIY